MKTRFTSMLAFVVSAFFITSCTTYAQSSYGYDDDDYYGRRSNSRYSTRNVTVQAENSDISYNLDLRAVANVFADSRDLEEFERRINDYDSGINNLDLNMDGQVDYLRVIETGRGNTHLVVLQAVVGYDTYQDVASIVVERRGNRRHYVQVIGDPYIYGPYYIIEPVYVYHPPIFSFFWGPRYYRWHSPYYWGYYPRYWRHWHPRPVNVYVTNINIYNNKYKHTYNYSNRIRSNYYNDMRKQVSRNDYSRANPQRSFASRNASRSNVNNHRDLVRSSNSRSAINSRTNSRANSQIRGTDTNRSNSAVRNNSNTRSNTRNNQTGVRSGSNTRGYDTGVRNNTNTRTNRNTPGAVRNSQEWNNQRSQGTTRNNSGVRSGSSNVERGSVNTPNRGNYEQSGRTNSVNRNSNVAPRTNENRNSTYSQPSRQTNRNSNVAPRSTQTNRNSGAVSTPNRSSGSRNSGYSTPSRSSSSGSYSTPSRSSSSSRGSGSYSAPSRSSSSSSGTSSSGRSSGRSSRDSGR